MLRIRFAVCLLVLVVCTLDVQSQVRSANVARRSMTARSLDIRIVGTACKRGSEVWVVMNGKENEAFMATPHPDGTCHWTADDLTFDTAFSRFSLRLSNSRTACSYADPDRQKKTGKLRFECCRTEARRMTVTANARIPISYTREVPDDSDGKKTPGCTELYSFHAYPIDVRSVWFPDDALYPDQRQAVSGSPGDLPSAEIFRMQLDRKEADPKAPGLIINDRSVTQYLNSAGGTLNITKMRSALREQRAKQKSSNSTAMSSNADDEMVESARRSGLKSITITLEK